MLVVLAPMGVHQNASGTAQAVLDYADPGARLVFSCGWHITRDGQDVYSWKIKVLVNVVGRLARLARVVDLDDQVEACRRVFASDTRWTVVRGSDLEEGESQGLPVWSRHVGDPILESNMTSSALITSSRGLFSAASSAISGSDRASSNLTRRYVSRISPSINSLRYSDSTDALSFINSAK